MTETQITQIDTKKLKKYLTSILSPAETAGPALLLGGRLWIRTPKRVLAITPTWRVGKWSHEELLVGDAGLDLQGRATMSAGAVMLTNLRMVAEGSALEIAGAHARAEVIAFSTHLRVESDSWSNAANELEARAAAEDAAKQESARLLEEERRTRFDDQDVARIKAEIEHMAAANLSRTVHGLLRRNGYMDGMVTEILDTEQGSTRLRAVVEGSQSISEYRVWWLTDENLYDMFITNRISTAGPDVRLAKIPVNSLGSLQSTPARGATARGIDLALVGTQTTYLPRCEKLDSAHRMSAAFTELRETAGNGSDSPLSAIFVESVEAVYGLDDVREGMHGVLVFYADRFEFRELGAPSRTVTTKTLDSIQTLAVGGPGEFTTGGGFAGGGFGLEGAAVGMLAAGLLNGLTARTSILTVIELTGDGYQLGATDTTFAPDVVNHALYPVYTAIRGRQGRQGATRHVGLDISEALAKLVSLRDSGALSSEEFAAAKQRLLFTDAS